MIHDCDVYRKNSRILAVPVTNPDDTVVDVTGWTAEFTLQTNVIGALPLVHLTTADNDARFTLGPDGVTVALLPADVDREPGWYVWDLRLVDPDNLAFTPIKGNLRILDALSTG